MDPGLRVPRIREGGYARIAKSARNERRRGQIRPLPWSAIAMREDRLTAAYLLASRRHGTLYLGSALDLVQRVSQHRESTIGFTAKYGVTRLVWYTRFGLVAEARARERSMKKWRREWKIALIEADNPDWRDLYPMLCGTELTPSRERN